MKNLVSRGRLFWMALSLRERTYLSALIMFVGVALLAQALWSSHQARVLLKKQIPLLRLQVESLGKKAAELSQLRARPAPRPTPIDANGLRAEAIAAANAAGLPEIASQIQLEGAGRVRLRTTLSFDRWIVWSATMQRDSRIRLIACTIESTGGSGMVKVDALFSLPDAG